MLREKVIRKEAKSSSPLPSFLPPATAYHPLSIPSLQHGVRWQEDQTTVFASGELRKWLVLFRHNSCAGIVAVPELWSFLSLSIVTFALSHLHLFTIQKERVEFCGSQSLQRNYETGNGEELYLSDWEPAWQVEGSMLSPYYLQVGMGEIWLKPWTAKAI